MPRNAAVISNCTDFYNLLRIQSQATCIPIESGQSFYSDDENALLDLHRFIFAPGFELSINQYTVKRDFSLECEPQYNAVEFQAVFSLADGELNKAPNIFVRLYGSDGTSRNCTLNYKNGKYLVVEMIVLLQHLSCYMDISFLTGLCCAEYQITDSSALTSLLTIVHHMINSYQSGNMLKLFYQAKSLELLSIITPVLAEKRGLICSSCNGLCKEDIHAIMQANKIIEERYSEPFSVKQLAAMVYINMDKLKTGYKEVYGTTVHEAVIARKMEIAYQLITNKHTSVKDVSLSVGYSNQGHFIDLFRRYYGVTPGELLRTS
ncbi:MAG TPA: AraC family transcriptional regulator [Syntrophomonas sp.]|nr:AraC family transcriptional regulator [Syntrophomonas sp.]